ncbi:excisionase family DNA-binding protein [Gemmiger sp.]
MKSDDPGTHVTESYLRRLVKEGAIPYVMDGTRVLVNVDTVQEYLLSATAIFKRRSNNND